MVWYIPLPMFRTTNGMTKPKCSIERYNLADISGSISLAFHSGELSAEVGRLMTCICILAFGIRLGRSQEALPPSGVNKGHVDKLGCLGNQCHLDSMALEVAERMSAKTMAEAAAVVYAAIRE